MKTEAITFPNLYCLLVRCCLIECDRSRWYTKPGIGALGCFPVEGESRRRCHPGLQGSEPPPSKPECPESILGEFEETLRVCCTAAGRKEKKSTSSHYTEP